MFDDTLNASWNERSRRGLTTLTSFGLQAVAVGALLVLPLLRPAGLPLFRQLSVPVSLGQPSGEAPAPRMHAGTSVAVQINAPAIILRPATRFRSGGQPAASSDPIGESGPFIPGALPTGDPNGVRNLFPGGSQPVIPIAPKPVVALVHVSQMSEGDLVHKILPTYPPLARNARIQGQVLLQAVISKQGAIENLRVLAGHPMLVSAAIEAVRQWRYRPYVLNNEPVEVETQITVNFSLAGN
jgi:periplasmic protein TonB